jgi:hypothetical protein
MTSNSRDDDAEEENSDKDVAVPHNYSKLVDGTILEDDEPTVDPINALILLLKLETKGYADNKEQA